MAGREHQRRTAALLALAQALYVCGSAIGLTLTGIVGAALAPSRALATLPFALVTVATALATVPASLLMARLGRRPVFLGGTAAGALGGAVAALGVVRGDFALFCAGNLGLGVFQACAQYYRFAATDAADAAFKARAVGLVIGGGVLAAVAGPTLAAWARDALPPHTFAGSYLAVAALALLSAAVLWRLDIPAPAAAGDAGPGRPLLAIVREPAFVAAAANGALAYAVMIFVMTATPLAVVGCGLSVDDAASVIQWHLVGMFAPGFVTGHVIARVGVVPVLLGGAALFAVGAGVALSGLTLPHFGVALALNGVAWNLMYVGATTLLARGLGEGAAPGERARAQAANEFLTFGVVALGSLLAGAVFERAGWGTVNAAILPALLLAALATAWFARAGAGRRVGAPPPLA